MYTVEEYHTSGESKLVGTRTSLRDAIALSKQHAAKKRFGLHVMYVVEWAKDENGEPAIVQQMSTEEWVWDLKIRAKIRKRMRQ
jgi:hypothetical protein